MTSVKDLQPGTKDTSIQLGTLVLKKHKLTISEAPDSVAQGVEVRGGHGVPGRYPPPRLEPQEPGQQGYTWVGNR